MNHARGSMALGRSALFLVLAISTACSSATSNAPVSASLELGSRVESMSGADLWNALPGIIWAHGPKDPRKCGQGGDKNCGARFDMAYIMRNGVQVLPDPWNGTYNGTIVGRIVNTGSRRIGKNVGPEAVYNVEKRGGDRHFVVVATLREGQRQYWVREVTPTNENKMAVSSGSWINCNHPAAPKSVKSRFGTCAEVHTSQENGSAPRVARLNERSPGWMECASSGCCTAGDGSLQ